MARIYRSPGPTANKQEKGPEEVKQPPKTKTTKPKAGGDK